MNPAQIIPAVLRVEAQAGSGALRARQVMPIVIMGAAIYGGVMGSFGGWPQILYSAVKVPLLLGVSFGLAGPSFFIVNTLLGVREDFRSALRAVCIAQAGVAITLCSLCPFTAVWYASSKDYQSAILFNGGMFAAATIAGQVVLRRAYRPLIKRDRRHRTLVRTWTVVYAFIAIQMAWVLRPFVGGPSEPTAFLRPSAWGNAYLVIGNLLWHLLHG